MPYRILILESMRDEAAAQRELYARERPLLQQHQLDYLYAAEYVALDETQPMQRRVMHSQEKSLDEEALLHRLNQRIASFSADILLVNSGALFRRYPDELLFVVQMLKRLHPGVRIGFHPRSFEKQPPKPFFEYTTEIGNLMTEAFAETPG